EAVSLPPRETMIRLSPPCQIARYRLQKDNSRQFYLFVVEFSAAHAGSWAEDRGRCGWASWTRSLLYVHNNSMLENGLIWEFMSEDLNRQWHKRTRCRACSIPRAPHAPRKAAENR